MKNLYLITIVGFCTAAGLIADSGNQEVRPVWSQKVVSHTSDGAVNPTWSASYESEKVAVMPQETFRGEIMTLADYREESGNADFALPESTHSARSGASQNPIDGARQGYDSGSATDRGLSESETIADNQIDGGRYVLVIRDNGILGIGASEKAFLLETKPKESRNYVNLGEILDSESGVLSFNDPDHPGTMNDNPQAYHDNKFDVTGVLIEKDGMDVILVDRVARVYTLEG